MTKRKIAEAPISKLIRDALEIYDRQNKLRYFRAHPIRLVTRKRKTFPVPIAESQKGAPDYFVFLFNCSETWFIETKATGKKLSPYQKRWSEPGFYDGFRYFKIDSVTEANQVLDFLQENI